MFNNKFYADKKNGMLSIIRMDCPDLLRQFISDIDDQFNRISIIKEHGWIKAGKLTLADGTCYFVKQYNNTTSSYKFRSIFREARPFSVLKKYSILESSNIKTSLAYGAMASRRFGFIRKEYLVTEFIKDFSGKDTYKTIFLNERLLNKYLEGAVILITRMHQAGLAHGDCKMSNFFIHSISEDSLSLGIFDLDGARYFKFGTWHYFIYSDIARFAVSICEEHHRIGMKADISAVSKKIFDIYEITSGKKLRLGFMLYHVKRHLKKKGFLK